MNSGLDSDRSLVSVNDALLYRPLILPETKTTSEKNEKQSCATSQLFFQSGRLLQHKLTNSDTMFQIFVSFNYQKRIQEGNEEKFYEWHLPRVWLSLHEW